MSQAGILNRGVYPPGTVTETIQGSNNGTLVAPPISPDASNNIILNSTNSNLTFSNGVGNILNVTVNTSPLLNYTNVAFAASPYNALITDIYISCDLTGGAITIRLPNAPAVGEYWIIKDRLGLANTNNITVTTVGGLLNIDGAPSYIINLAYGSAQFIFNGSAYEVF